MTQFAIINTVTNICENVIVADTADIANLATAAHLTPVAVMTPATQIIGLVYDWDKQIFTNPALNVEG